MLWSKWNTTSSRFELRRLKPFSHETIYLGVGTARAVRRYTQPLHVHIIIHRKIRTIMSIYIYLLLTGNMNQLSKLPQPK